MNAMQKREQLRNARAYLSQLLSYDAMIEVNNAAKAEALRILTREEREQVEAIAARIDKNLLRLDGLLYAVMDRDDGGKA